MGNRYRIIYREYRDSNNLRMNQIEAIKYLVDNSVYEDEWSGTGMWHAVEKVMKRKQAWTQKRLKELLKEAKDN